MLLSDYIYCSLWHRQAMCLQQAVALCMDHCQAAGLTGDDNWFKTVVLAGGTACLPGLAGINQFSTLIAFVSAIVFGLQ